MASDGEKRISLRESTVNRLIEYIGGRPWAEVYQIMGPFLQDVHEGRERTEAGSIRPVSREEREAYQAETTDGSTSEHAVRDQGRRGSGDRPDRGERVEGSTEPSAADDAAGEAADQRLGDRGHGPDDAGDT